MKINLQKINFLKLSLIISLIGIFLLLLLSNVLEPKLIDIKDINSGFLDKEVKVQGFIFDTRIYSSNFQVISIKDDTGKIDVTINRPIDKLKNKNITVIGTITEYEKDLQIQADKILLR